MHVIVPHFYRISEPKIFLVFPSLPFFSTDFLINHY